MASRSMLLSMVVVAGQSLLLATGAVADPVPQSVPAAAQHPLMVIEQHRASVVQRIVSEWTDSLATLPADRQMTAQQLSEALWALRSDRLLAASLAGSFSTIESLLADAKQEGVAVQRVAAKASGNANADLVFTPINPCRIVNTRNVGGALTANTARTFDGFSSDFSAQGGTASNCGMPNGVAAIAMNVYAVDPTNLGFIKVWAANGAEPAVSTVNYQVGITAIATGAIVPVDSTNSNRFTAKSPAGVNFIADVVGYFKRPGNYGGAHVITGLDATDSGGLDNTASGIYSTVGGGDNNAATNDSSVVAGGAENTANGVEATVGGGGLNTASGKWSTVGGGIANTASGDSSTVVGGDSNTAAGTFSVVMGFDAHANHSGAFVFADSTFGPFSSTVANQFMVAASGGIGLFTNKNYATYCVINAGSGTWTCSSSRTVKRDFEAVDAAAVLAKVATLPMSSWRYMNEAESIRHLGPFAEDFRAAFGLGADDKSIATVDEGGVALAAIQGLNAKVDAGEAALHKELRSKDAEIAALKDRVGQLEAAAADENTMLSELAELRRAVEVLMVRTSSEGRLADSR